MENSITKLRSLRILCVLFILALFCMNSVAASIKEASIDVKPLKLMEKFRERDDSFLNSLATDKDIYVVIYATSTISDIYVLARPSVDPKQLASMLESAVQGTKLASKPIAYMQGKGFTWADAYIDYSQFGSRDAEMRHPVGKVISRLSKAGLKPHILLCTLKGMTVSHKLNLYGFGKRNWIVSNVNPTRTDLDFSLSNHLSSKDVALGMLLFFTIPIIGIIAFPILIYIARSKRNTPEGRRSLFTNWYRKLMMICISVIFTIAFTNLQSPLRLRLGDMWLGQASGGIWIFVLLAPAAFIGLSNVVARIIFRGDTSGRTKLDRNKLQHLRYFFGIFALLLLTEQLARFLPENALLVHNRFFVVLCLWMFLDSIYGQILRNWTRISGARTPDNDLFVRFSDRALQFGLSLKQVELVDTLSLGKCRTNAIFRGNGTLFIRRELIEKLSTGEMDFIIYHEFAHAAHHHQIKALAMLFSGTLLFFLPAVLFITQPLNISLLNWQLWSIAVGLIMLLVETNWFSKKREEEADRLVLDITGDPQTARQAITKASGIIDLPFKTPSTDIAQFQFDAMVLSRLRWLKKQSSDVDKDADNIFGKVEQNDALTIRAQDMAARLGVRLTKIEVISHAADKPLVNAAALRGNRIVIGRALLDSFTLVELDFVLAHELAHLKRKHVLVMLACLPISLVLFGAGILLAFLHNLSTMIYSYWIMTFGGALLIGNLTWLNRRRELEADRIALRITCNLPAAISALIKLSTENPLIIPEELEEYLTHPKCEYRIQALKKEAKKLKLIDVE